MKKKRDCSASTSNSAETEDQETCRSSKRIRSNEKNPTTYCVICSKLNTKLSLNCVE